MDDRIPTTNFTGAVSLSGLFFRETGGNWIGSRVPVKSLNYTEKWLVCVCVCVFERDRQREHFQVHNFKSLKPTYWAYNKTLSSNASISNTKRRGLGLGLISVNAPGDRA